MDSRTSFEHGKGENNPFQQPKKANQSIRTEQHTKESVNHETAQKKILILLFVQFTRIERSSSGNTYPRSSISICSSSNKNETAPVFISA